MSKVPMKPDWCTEHFVPQPDRCCVCRLDINRVTPYAHGCFAMLVLTAVNLGVWIFLYEIAKHWRIVP